MRTPRVPRILLFLCRTRPTGYWRSEDGKPASQTGSGTYIQIGATQGTDI